MRLRERENESGAKLGLVHSIHRFGVGGWLTREILKEFNCFRFNIILQLFSMSVFKLPNLY